MKSYFTLLWTIFAMIIGVEMASAQAAQTFPSAANLVVTINANVGSGSTTGMLAYTYTVVNSPTSRQALAQWAIQYDAAVSIVVTGTPPGWRKNAAIGGQPFAGWTGILDVLSSGSKQSGFAIESQGLPGIVQAFAMGDIPVAQLPQFPEGQAPESLPGSSILDNSAKGQTVGPTAVPPSSFDPLTFVGRIISLKEQAVALGWIDNRGIGNSLDSKLNAAQASLARNNTPAAKNQLNALLNEVDAQSGKQLSPEAVALLKFNTQYLISKIP